MQPNTPQDKAKQLRCCVVIPTYNNAATLTRVLDGVLKITPDLIVVNDGSTDSTPQILSNYTTITRVDILKNKGKGNALRMGLKAALKLGFEYAITIDSDGQHFPEDIPVFLDALELSKEKDVMLIGARNMNHESIPGKSSFGHNFSNFWYWIETGIKLTDTQCGFRLYPLQKVHTLNLWTQKFEYESEVMVKAAWEGTTVKNVPIQVLYDPEERVSHFRPIIDFTRIFIIRIELVLKGFFYIKPRNLIRKFKKIGLKRFFVEEVLGHNDPPKKKAISVALGTFIALSPLWGFQTILVLFLAVILRLNKAIAFAFSNLSLPPFIPFVILAGLQTGVWLTGNAEILSFKNIDVETFLIDHLGTYILGSFVLATIMAVILGTVAYFIMLYFERKKTVYG